VAGVAVRLDEVRKARRGTEDGLSIRGHVIEPRPLPEDRKLPQSWDVTHQLREEPPEEPEARANVVAGPFRRIPDPAHNLAVGGLGKVNAGMEGNDHYVGYRLDGLGGQDLMAHRLIWKLHPSQSSDLTGPGPRGVHHKARRYPTPARYHLRDLTATDYKVRNLSELLKLHPEPFCGPEVPFHHSEGIGVAVGGAEGGPGDGRGVEERHDLRHLLRG